MCEKCFIGMHEYCLNPIFEQAYGNCCCELNELATIGTLFNQKLEKTMNITKKEVRTQTINIELDLPIAKSLRDILKRYRTQVLNDIAVSEWFDELIHGLSREVQQDFYMKL